MSSNATKVFLKNVATGAAVEAELREGITMVDLVAWKTTWQPMVNDVLEALVARGVPRKDWPQSWHWNWVEKVFRSLGLLGQPSFCIWAEGKLQGLMLLDLTKSSRMLGRNQNRSCTSTS